MLEQYEVSEIRSFVRSFKSDDTVDSASAEITPADTNEAIFWRSFNGASLRSGNDVSTVPS